MGFKSCSAENKQRDFTQTYCSVLFFQTLQIDKKPHSITCLNKTMKPSGCYMISLLRATRGQYRAKQRISRCRDLLWPGSKADFTHIKRKVTRRTWTLNSLLFYNWIITARFNKETYCSQCMQWWSACHVIRKISGLFGEGRNSTVLHL